jgi:hypothetical protein
MLWARRSSASCLLVAAFLTTGLGGFVFFAAFVAALAAVGLAVRAARGQTQSGGAVTGAFIVGILVIGVVVGLVLLIALALATRPPAANTFPERSVGRVAWANVPNVTRTGHRRHGCTGLRSPSKGIPRRPHR